MAKAKRKFIKKAIKRKGALKRALGVPKDKPIPIAKARAAAKRKGLVGEEARFFLNVLRPASRRKSRRRKSK